LVFGVTAGLLAGVEPGAWEVILETSMENETAEELTHGYW
jgi:hypothetical protein